MRRDEQITNRNAGVLWMDGQLDVHGERDQNQVEKQINGQVGKDRQVVKPRTCRYLAS